MAVGHCLDRFSHQQTNNGSLELLPLDPSAAGSGDIIEAQIGAQQFAEQAFRDGEVLVLTPRKARVFVA